MRGYRRYFSKSIFGIEQKICISMGLNRWTRWNPMTLPIILFRWANFGTFVLDFIVEIYAPLTDFVKFRARLSEISENDRKGKTCQQGYVLIDWRTLSGMTPKRNTLAPKREHLVHTGSNAIMLNPYGFYDIPSILCGGKWVPGCSLCTLSTRNIFV